MQIIKTQNISRPNWKTYTIPLTCIPMTFDLLTSIRVTLVKQLPCPVGLPSLVLTAQPGLLLNRGHTLLWIMR